LVSALRFVSAGTDAGDHQSLGYLQRQKQSSIDGSAYCVDCSVRSSVRKKPGFGSDFLMDGGVTASYWFGDLAPK
jgi:hypothetical protein